MAKNRGGKKENYADLKIGFKFSDEIMPDEEDAIFAEVFDILQIFNEEFNGESAINN